MRREAWKRKRKPPTPIEPGSGSNPGPLGLKTEAITTRVPALIYKEVKPA